jgi:hypothetical protein
MITSSMIIMLYHVTWGRASSQPAPLPRAQAALALRNLKIGLKKGGRKLQATLDDYARFPMVTMASAAVLPGFAPVKCLSLQTRSTACSSGGIAKSAALPKPALRNKRFVSNFTGKQVPLRLVSLLPADLTERSDAAVSVVCL